MAGVYGNVSFIERDSGASVKKIIATWYSGSGDYNGTAWGTTTNFYDGYIIEAMTTTANTPQNAYNVFALDNDGIDVLAGACLTRTNTLTQYITSQNLGAVSHSQLNIYVANANFNRNGTVVLFIR